MKESNKAKQAFEDYFNLGPGRSLRKLTQTYREVGTKSAPTKHFSTLQKWSATHKWQDRIAQRDLEIAKARLDVIKEKATETGYAIFYKRIHDLGVIAERMFKLLEVGPLPPATIREFRGLLDDIAKEKGERIRKEAIELTGKDGGPIEIDHAAAARDSLTLLVASQVDARKQKELAGGTNGR